MTFAFICLRVTFLYAPSSTLSLPPHPHPHPYPAYVIWRMEGILFWASLSFRDSHSWERIDGIGPNDAYAFTLTWSKFGLLRVNFREYTTQSWPLIIVKISFPLYILRTNWWNRTKFCIYIDVDQIKVGIATRYFPRIYKTVMILDYCQNFVCAQYLKKKLMELDRFCYAFGPLHVV